MPQSSASELVDRQHIHDVVLRYCRDIDRLDLELVRSVYHPDWVDHHTGFDGSVDGFLAWVGPLLRRLSGTTHLVGNHLADLHGDRAVVETYGNAVHREEPTDDPRRNFTSGFRYVDLMTRRGGRWVISERWAVREWTRSDAGRSMRREGPGPSGFRDRRDPLYVATERVAR